MRFACGVLLTAALAALASALTEQVATDFEMFIPRLGPPLASNAIPALSPRFHRILGHTHKVIEAGKAQTALFSVTDTNVVGAVNPRNGAIVWRQQIHAPVQGLYTDSDLVVVVSGKGGERIEMFHALTGFLLWFRQVLPPGSGQLAVSNDSQREALPGSDITWLPIIDQPRYDVLALSNADTLRRVDTDSGKDLWVFSRTANGENSATNPSIRILSTSSTHVHLLSLESAPADSFGLQHQVLSAQSGALLYTASLPGVSIDRTRGAADVLLLGLNSKAGSSGQSTATPPEPHVVWRQNDGTIKSLPLPLPPIDVVKSFAPKKAQPQTLMARSTADPFTEIRDVRMGDQGFVIGVRQSGRGEVVQLQSTAAKVGPRKLYSTWEFEEEALDAIYSGNFDRNGAPYINRVYFTSAQHLLNFHVFWAQTNDNQGQVTGFSFQWDHDMHGDVLACSFEVSPISPYQLVTRAAFATRSGALHMIQEDRHQWINEEGLVGTQHMAFVDLPRRARPLGSDLSSEEALRLLRKEALGARVLRHAAALQALPKWFFSNLRAIWTSTITKKSSAVSALGRKADSAVTNTSPNSVSRRQVSVRYDDLPPRPPRGGLPAREIAPAKNAAATAASAPGMSKSQRTKAINQAKVAEEEPVDSVGPRTLKADEASHNFYSDKWGLRQLMLSATTWGKLYAQDTGMKGQFVWEKSLVGFGLGEGQPTPHVNVKYLGVVRESQVKEGKQLDPLVYIVAEINSTAATASSDVLGRVSQIWQLYPLTGEFVDGAMTGRPLFMGGIQDVRKLKGQEVLAVVDESRHLHLWPQTPKTARDFAASALTMPYFYTEIDAERRSLTGFGLRQSNVTPSNVLPLAKKWQWDLPQGERVVSMQTSSVLTDAPIASRGRDLNDWFLTKLSKLLDPSIAVVVTFASSNQRLSVYLVDQASGSVLHSLEAPDAGHIDLVPGAHVTFDENWLTLSYNVRDPEQDVMGGRILSVEYYDTSSASERLLSNWFVKSMTPRADINSKDAKARGKAFASRAQQIKVFSKAFILPTEFEGVGAGGTGVTETLHGASDKALLVLTGSEELAMIPRKLLDPRRPLPKGTVSAKQTREEADPMMPVYDALLPFDEKRVLTHSVQVLSSAGAPAPVLTSRGSGKMVFSRRTKLESTTLVGVHGHGSTDSFLTKVTTGGDFDLLSETFNKLQLLLTTALLGLGFVGTRPLVRSRALQARWL